MLTSSIGRPIPDETAPSVVVFDLDRTITRRGTYTPFLMHCVPAHQRTFERLPMAVWLTAIYALGMISRDDVKARMLDVNIVGCTRAQIAVSHTAIGRRSNVRWCAGTQCIRNGV
jgi:hypothetical protein